VSVRHLHRMRLIGEPPPAPGPAGAAVRGYAAERDHTRIPLVYAAAFGEPPWPDDWDRFAAFDPRGVFVAEERAGGEAVGFVTSFGRGDFGYVGVLAVVPGWRRRGVARALLRTAVVYLRSLGPDAVEVDAFVDARPAVALYRACGFEVIRTYADPEAEPDAAAAGPSSRSAAPDGAQGG